MEAQGDPEPVRDLKALVAAADALLIATPEYNYSVPGVLKNAIDWSSRPPDRIPLQGKPVAIMGATPDMLGTSRAQSALRQSFVFTRSPALMDPEVYVLKAAECFSADGTLTDEGTRERVRNLAQALVAWMWQLQARPAGYQLAA